MKLLFTESLQKCVKQAGFGLSAVPWVKQGEFQGSKVGFFGMCDHKEGFDCLSLCRK